MKFNHETLGWIVILHVYQSKNSYCNALVNDENGLAHTINLDELNASECEDSMHNEFVDNFNAGFDRIIEYIKTMKENDAKKAEEYFRNSEEAFKGFESEEEARMNQEELERNEHEFVNTDILSGTAAQKKDKKTDQSNELSDPFNALNSKKTKK